MRGYKLFYVVSSLLVLLPASLGALAQESFSGSERRDQVRQVLPSDEAAARAAARARAVLLQMRLLQAPSNGKGVPGAPIARPSLPNVDALPKAAAPAPDLGQMAEQYKRMTGRQPEPDSPPSKPDLMVFVSFSMPVAALASIVNQAERAKATLVFRGLEGDSLKKMTQRVATLIGTRSVSAVIHPPAFQQFSVTEVPALVIAQKGAGDVLSDGCAKADTFVKLSGDVTIDYALDYIERASAEWAAIARSFRLSMRGPGTATQAGN